MYVSRHQHFFVSKGLEILDFSIIHVEQENKLPIGITKKAVKKIPLKTCHKKLCAGEKERKSFKKVSANPFDIY